MRHTWSKALRGCPKRLRKVFFHLRISVETFPTLLNASIQPFHYVSAIPGATPKVQGSRDVFCDHFNQKLAGTAACILQTYRESGSTPGRKSRMHASSIAHGPFYFLQQKGFLPADDLEASGRQSGLI